MTASFKLCRPYLEKFYRDIINSLLANMSVSPPSYDDMLASVVGEALGVESSHSEIKKSTIKQLGGDSLTTVRLAQLLKDKLNISLPLGWSRGASLIN